MNEHKEQRELPPHETDALLKHYGRTSEAEVERLKTALSKEKDRYLAERAEEAKRTQSRSREQGHER